MSEEAKNIIFPAIILIMILACFGIILWVILSFGITSKSLANMPTLVNVAEAIAILVGIKKGI
jgi:cytochrome b subunit of formate dehydrogenase